MKITYYIVSLDISCLLDASVQVVFEQPDVT